jgi:hypothetical protein
MEREKQVCPNSIANKDKRLFGVSKNTIVDVVSFCQRG